MLKRICLILLLAVMAVAAPAGCVKVGDNSDEPQVDIQAGDAELEAN